MFARVAERVTWYRVLGKTVHNIMRRNVVCACNGLVSCVVWLWEWWCTSCVSTVIQFYNATVTTYFHMFSTSYSQFIHSPPR